jgi:hypothetical protein
LLLPASDTAPSFNLMMTLSRIMSA